MDHEAPLPSGTLRSLFVILQRLSPIGGIETLTLRLIPYLLPAGDVAVFGTRKDDDVVLPAGVPFLPVASDADLIGSVAGYVARQDPDRDIVMVSLHPWTLVIVYVLRYVRAMARRRPIRSFHLVTHGRAMFFSGGRVTQGVIRDIFLRAPAASTYFMNVATRDAHAVQWRLNLDRFPILRLPIGDLPPIRVAEVGHALRIVSVGRLVEFKGYHRGAPQIVRDLLDRGIDAHWDIWGEGEDRAQIEQEVERLEVGHRLSLKGDLPYVDYDAAVAAADVFVGVGTALLEAARLGIPSICGVEMSPFESYGFVSETPSDSIGDRIPGVERQLILDKLTAFVAMDAQARHDLGEACQQEVASRSATLAAFAGAVITSRPWPVSYDPRAILLAVAGWAGTKLRDRVIRRHGT